MSTFTIALFGFMAMITAALAKPEFVNLLPNGRSVPNPCSPKGKWLGVGHTLHGGGGPGNPFGTDFYFAGHKWTPELCRKDSDGDGIPNGVELGDPNCTWVNSTTRVAGPAIGHPGICEPVWNETCKAKQTWLTADNCAFIKNPPTSGATASANNAPTTTEAAQQYGWTDVQSGCYCTCLRLPAGSAPWDHHDENDEGEKRRRRRDAGNSNPMAQFGPPPVADATQFNDSGYAVQMPCYCACPKA